MPKSKLETIYETVRDKFLADQNLSAYIRTGTGRWYCYEAVHSDFPLGGDEELGTNVADCPCVILRITDAPMELSHNALDSIPLAIRVDMRTEAQDQRESVRFLTYALQEIADQADANWGLSAYGVGRTEIRNGPRLRNLTWEQRGGVIWRWTFDLVLVAQLAYSSNGFFET